RWTARRTPTRSTSAATRRTPARTGSGSATRGCFQTVASSPDHAPEREPERSVLPVREHWKRSEDASAGRAAGLKTAPNPAEHCFPAARAVHAPVASLQLCRHRSPRALSTRAEGAVMKIFIDSGDIGEIKEAQAMGVIDGVTTNPSLLSKAGKPTRQ